MTPKFNPTPRNNPHNLVPNVPADPDSTPSFLDSSLSESSHSSDDGYIKQVSCTEEDVPKSSQGVGIWVHDLLVEESWQIQQK